MYPKNGSTVLFRPAAIKRGLMGALVIGTPANLVPNSVLAAGDTIYTRFFSNISVSGYDPVAYFTQGKPVIWREKQAEYIIKGDANWSKVLH